MKTSFYVAMGITFSPIFFDLIKYQDQKETLNLSRFGSRMTVLLRPVCLQ